MKTAKGIYLDLKESEYLFTLNNVNYYFSSILYLEKFKENVKDFVKNETMKLKQKYKIDINFIRFLQIAFYKKIEKRGFRIVIENKEFNEDDFIIFTNLVEKSD